jgi:hypothetical protein
MTENHKKDIKDPNTLNLEAVVIIEAEKTLINKKESSQINLSSEKEIKIDKEIKIEKEISEDIIESIKSINIGVPVEEIAESMVVSLVMLTLSNKKENIALNKSIMERYAFLKTNIFSKNFVIVIVDKDDKKYFLSLKEDYPKKEIYLDVNGDLKNKFGNKQLIKMFGPKCEDKIIRIVHIKKKKLQFLKISSKNQINLDNIYQSIELTFTKYIPLKVIVSDQNLFLYFKEQLMNEYNEEHVEFLEHYFVFKNPNTNQKEKKIRFDLILEQKKDLNFDHVHSKKVIIDESGIDIIFEEVMKNLSDPFHRFIMTKLYKEMDKKFNEYDYIRSKYK